MKAKELIKILGLDEVIDVYVTGTLCDPDEKCRAKKNPPINRADCSGCEIHQTHLFDTFVGHISDFPLRLADRRVRCVYLVDGGDVERYYRKNHLNIPDAERETAVDRDRTYISIKLSIEDEE